MTTIKPPSIRLKLKMRFSVLLTVLKLRFSRVRKYFWLREMVDNWAESLRIDSSRMLVCSGEDPCFDGMAARGASFSTWGVLVPLCWNSRVTRKRRGAYGDFKVDQLLCESAHLVVEAEAVLADFIGCEDEVTLSFLGSVEDDFLLPAIGSWADNRIINVERTTSLNGEIECDFRALVLNVCEEASLLVCIEAVG